MTPQPIRGTSFTERRCSGRWCLVLLLVWGMLGGAAARARALPFPVLFIPGLNESAEDWTPVRTLLAGDLGLRYGGVVNAEGLAGPWAEPEKADFFFVQLPTTAALMDQVHRLRGVIQTMGRISGAERFVVVGFSLGGLVARLYLTEYPDRHRLAKLVTVASPHQGSNLANVVYLANWCREMRSGGGDRGWTERTGTTMVCSALDGLEEKLGIKLNVPVLRDLVPREGYSLLEERGRVRHPMDLDYAVIIARAPKLTDPETMALYVQEITSGFDEAINSLNAEVVDWIRRMLPSLVPGGMEKFGVGDGAVSADSQDMSLLPWFQGHLRLVEKPGFDGLRQYRGKGKEGVRMEVLELSAHHHFAARRDLDALWRMISGPSVLRDVTWSGSEVRGELRDYLFNPKKLRLHMGEQESWREVEAKAQARGFRFWLDVQGVEGASGPYRVSYPFTFGDGLEPREQDVVAKADSGGMWLLLVVLVVGLGAAVAVAVAFGLIRIDKTKKSAGDEWDDSF